MKLKKILFILFFLALGLNITLEARLSTRIKYMNSLIPFKEEKELKTQFGEKLVNNLFKYIEEKDSEELRNIISPAFQSIHMDGARNKAQELELLKHLAPKFYKINDVKTTSVNNLYIVTYEVTAEQSINGKRIKKNKSPRISVFIKKDNSWKWVAHANMAPLKKN
ncbi:MAG: nuclear transport factor 2 family protein [Victivallales bacterium]|nr:nuclear transport factor 2 family protein [Victivallales bacterium]